MATTLQEYQQKFNQYLNRSRLSCERTGLSFNHLIVDWTLITQSGTPSSIYCSRSFSNFALFNTRASVPRTSQGLIFHGNADRFSNQADNAFIAHKIPVTPWRCSFCTTYRRSMLIHQRVFSSVSENLCKMCKCKHPFSEVITTTTFSTLRKRF